MLRNNSTAFLLLLKRAKQDPEALNSLVEEIYDPFSKILNKFYLHYSGRRTGIELDDVVHSAMARFIEVYVDEDIDKFWPWLETFLHHRYVDFIRKHRQFHELTDADLDKNCLHTFKKNDVADSKMCVQQLLQNLSNKDRQIMYALMMDLPHKKIGKAFGIKTKSVSKKLKGILKKLDNFQRR